MFGAQEAPPLAQRQAFRNMVDGSLEAGGGCNINNTLTPPLTLGVAYISTSARRTQLLTTTPNDH